MHPFKNISLQHVNLVKNFKLFSYLFEIEWIEMHLFEIQTDTTVSGRPSQKYTAWQV